MDLRTLTATVVLSVFAGITGANSPPNPPVILEPAEGATGISPSDVHMATAAADDPDAGDGHRCSDWEIRSRAGDDLQWSATCASGPLAVHIHLGDGSFEGVAELSAASRYVLRVRHRDDSADPETEASLWSEREFTTGEPVSVYPMKVRRIAFEPPPRWYDEEGTPIDAARAAVSIVGSLEKPLGELKDSGWEPTGHEQSEEHHAIAVIIRAAASLILPETTLEFRDESGALRQVFLPVMILSPGDIVRFWIGNDGSTYHSAAANPNFTSLARSAPAPWIPSDPALRIERIATGFRLPVDLAFARPGSDDADAPWLYVAELYGAIKVIARDRTISDYATNLLDFGMEGPFPGTGEQGIGGIAVDGETGDLFVTLPYFGGNPRPVPRVILLRSNDGGRTAAEQSVVFELDGARHVSSHQISNISIGSDGMLYVHVGDGMEISKSREPDSFYGKILRMGKDGSAPPDNPLYDSTDGISAKDYVFAMGLRNPFGGAWRARTDTLYVVGNGPLRDRFAEVVPGRDFMWDGSDTSMLEHALYTWQPSVAPVRLDFLQQDTFDGSGFGSRYLDIAAVTESGPTWARGPQARGKRVTFLRLNDDGRSAEPVAEIRYAGSGRSTAAGLAAGPDGLYFSDLYRDDGTTPIDRGASIFRVRYAGQAKFSMRTSPDDPMTIEVTDESDVPEVVARTWTFGDEATSSASAERHTFEKAGVHTVRLRVRTNRDDLVASATLLAAPGVEDGLLGEYFNGPEPIGQPQFRRIDPVIDYEWGQDGAYEGGPNDDFAVRWSGLIVARFSGAHTFHVVADDGVRVWVGGSLIVDQWAPGPARESRGTVWLAAGQPTSIRIEYFEAGNEAVMKLLWSNAFHGPELVPSAQLRRPSGRARIVGGNR